jgi:hypothetical protein
MATVIAYVDGFNLYHGLHDKYRRRYLWLDLEHLVQRLRPSDRIMAVRYFTALVRDDPSALARQRTYLDALSAHRGSKVEVRASRSARDCSCRISQGTEPAGHLPTLNVGCQKLRGQKRIEMKY